MPKNLWEIAGQISRVISDDRHRPQLAIDRKLMMHKSHRAGRIAAVLTEFCRDGRLGVLLRIAGQVRDRCAASFVLAATSLHEAATLDVPLPIADAGLKSL